MISKILIAVDGSPHSLKGVAMGAQIAAGLDARVILLYVVKREALHAGLEEFARAEHIKGPIDIEILKEGAKHLLRGAIETARAAGVKDVESEVEEGPIARTIVARAKDHKADIIVVGSRGMGDIEGLLRGGVSHRVEILAKCPVLVVK
jgi:nucleotide-binding universal stress UspA family protein